MPPWKGSDAPNLWKVLAQDLVHLEKSELRTGRRAWRVSAESPSLPCVRTAARAWSPV